eukprot:GHVS01071218.1.p1 GENE.GHVS01071218.1~~GHVS01071218.1.p1  ORF type:complete len:275 (+),score=101.08 GHVS01071218.1:1-825(+)
MADTPSSFGNSNWDWSEQKETSSSSQTQQQHDVISNNSNVFLVPSSSSSLSPSPFNVPLTHSFSLTTSGPSSCTPPSLQTASSSSSSLVLPSSSSPCVSYSSASPLRCSSSPSSHSASIGSTLLPPQLPLVSQTPISLSRRRSGTFAHANNSPQASSFFPCRTTSSRALPSPIPLMVPGCCCSSSSCSSVSSSLLSPPSSPRGAPPAATSSVSSSSLFSSLPPLHSSLCPTPMPLHYGFEGLSSSPVSSFPLEAASRLLAPSTSPATSPLLHPS